MSMKAFFPSALLLVLTTAGPGLAADDLETYLTEDKGRKVLKEPLTLREEQGGIAGITGTLWTVEPSGKWRVERFRRDKDGSEDRTPMRSGTLSAAQLEALAKTLAARDLAGLPVKTGRKAPVNPHNITITFGKKSATIQGLPARGAIRSRSTSGSPSPPRKRPTPGSVSGSPMWSRPWNRPVRRRAGPDPGPDSLNDD